MYLGNSEIDKVYLGSTEISKAYLGSDLVYEPEEPVNFFKIVNNTSSAGTITFMKHYSAQNITLRTYKSDERQWSSATTLSATTTFNLPANGYIKFDGSENVGFNTYGDYWSFSCDVPHDVEGDIMTLTSGDTMTEGIFSHLFGGRSNVDTQLVNASGLTLPDTTAVRCYMYMFKGCTSLETAPVLSATTLADYCYSNMFEGCTALTTAPALPATTLVERSYYGMFSGCTSLEEIHCSATTISASLCTTHWVDNVAASGTFYCDPTMTSTWTTGVDGVPTGWTIQAYSA